MRASNPASQLAARRVISLCDWKRMAAVAVAEELDALLGSPAPEIMPPEAAALAREGFGLSGTAFPLPGGRNRNFHIRTADGPGHVLKVIHPAEQLAVTDFQSRALLHLAGADPGLPVPRLHPPISGKGLEALWQAPGGPLCRVRLLDFRPGRPLGPAASSVAQRHAVGACLARLDLAFRGFRHPAESHPLPWDIQRAARLRRLIAHLPAVGDRGLAAGMLDRFERHALPLLPGLRPQVIHNAFGPRSILVEEAREDEVAGIIHFGDMVRAPLVQDLGTAAAHQIMPEGHPLVGPADLALAFHRLCPLTPEEVAILPDLIVTRLTVSVCVSGWLAARQPEHAAPVLQGDAHDLSRLRRLGMLPREEAQRYLRERLAA